MTQNVKYRPLQQLCFIGRSRYRTEVSTENVIVRRNKVGVGVAHVLPITSDKYTARRLGFRQADLASAPREAMQDDHRGGVPAQSVPIARRVSHPVRFNTEPKRVRFDISTTTSI
jgi:hypothetical protein